MKLTSSTDSSPSHTLTLVLAATVVTVLLMFVPYASILTYPLRLFATFIHETGHILGALLTFGDVKNMVVHLDTSGLTWTSGGSRFIIGSSGYLGTALFGALMVVMARSAKTAKWALGATGAVILAVTALYAGEASTIPVWIGLAVAGAAGAGMVMLWDKWSARLGLGAVAGVALLGVTGWLLATNGLLTWLLGLVCGLALLAGGYFAKDGFARGLTAFLGVQVGLNAIQDIQTLIGLSVNSSTHTDAQNMARDFGLPAIVWSIGWMGIAIVLLAGALIFVYRDWSKTASAAA